jgi:HAD superfamily hydrolase (TIGR01490 family)
MSAQPPYVAFFDLDETLLAKNSGRVFWDYCIENKIYSAGDVGYLGFALFKFLLGIDDTEDFVRTWASVFKGWSQEKMEEVTRELFDLRIKQVIRQGAEAEVKKHKVAGARTVILSASTRYVCEPVKNHLAMDEALCTALAIQDGKFTGTLASPYIFGEQKYLSALSYAQEHGYDLSKCYYYGDAYTDRFVMEAVGFPVCVTPDKKLRAHAAQKNWSVVEW